MRIPRNRFSCELEERETFLLNLFNIDLTRLNHGHMKGRIIIDHGKIQSYLVAKSAHRGIQVDNEKRYEDSQAASQGFCGCKTCFDIYL